MAEVIARHYEFKETQFGFKWGPLEVTRLMSDPKMGVVIGVKAGADEYEVRASPTGRVLEAIKLDRKPAPVVELDKEQQDGN